MTRIVQHKDMTASIATRFTYIPPNYGFTDDWSPNGPITTTDNAKAWSALNSSWAASSGAAVATISSGNGLLIADVGSVSGSIEVPLLGAYHASAGIVFGALDGSNNLYLNWSGGNQPTLFKRVANVSTELGRGLGGAWVPGDILKVIWNRTSQTVRVRKNGVDVLAVSGVTDFADQTKAGLFLASAGAAAGTKFGPVRATATL